MRFLLHDIFTVEVNLYSNKWVKIGLTVCSMYNNE